MAKIMVVDDNKSIVTTLDVLLRKTGHDVDVAYNGDEFLDKVRDVNPDLVLLDIMMPGLKTREILAKLNDMKLKDLKIILLTAVRMGEDEVKELKTKSNIVDYITKPYDLDDFLARIETALK
ncbi:MAG: response regulator transcription factor [Candidatus Syntropharchaeales archaeon]|nr:response regulator [Candidatus Syntrophoarchaeum sp.]